MSDFLVNLARRSAGLAPVMRSRPAPAAESAGDAVGETGIAEIAMPGESASPPAVVVMPHAMPPSPSAVPTSEARRQPIAAPLAASPAAVVQRAPLAAPNASPAPPPSPVMRAAGLTPVAISPAPAAPEPAQVVTAAAPPSAEPIAIEPRGESRIEIRHPAVAHPHADPPKDAAPVAQPDPLAPPGAVVPSASAGPRAIEPRAESHSEIEAPVIRHLHADFREEAPPLAPPGPQALREREVVHEETRVVERLVEPAAAFVIEPAPARLTEPAVLTLEPAPRAAAATAPPRPEPPAERTAERTVHVRIGAVEIHAAPPASAPLPPTPPAAVAPQAAPAGGFDEFARLRSYAPWEW